MVLERVLLGAVEARLVLVRLMELAVETSQVGAVQPEAVGVHMVVLDAPDAQGGRGALELSFVACSAVLGRLRPLVQCWHGWRVQR